LPRSALRTSTDKKAGVRAALKEVRQSDGIPQRINDFSLSTGHGPFRRRLIFFYQCATPKIAKLVAEKSKSGTLLLNSSVASHASSLSKIGAKTAAVDTDTISKGWIVFYVLY